MGSGCLVLDFDGTVRDTESTRYRVWAEQWEEHGHTLEMAEWKRALHADDTFDPWAALERLVGGPLDPALHGRRLARRDELQRDHGPRAGIVSWLEEARSTDVPVGIATSSPASWVEHNLDELGLRHYFSCLVCPDDGVAAKPDPACYLTACNRLGGNPARSVAVEDSPRGVAAAVSAGLFTVATPHGLTADLDLSLADVRVESLDDLSLSEALRAAGRRRR